MKEEAIHILFENSLENPSLYITFQLQCFYVAGGYFQCSDETLAPI